MTVKITLLPERKVHTLVVGKNADGFELLKALSINPENVIIVRDDTPIPVDSHIRQDDVLKVIRVVSGG